MPDEKPVWLTDEEVEAEFERLLRVYVGRLQTDAVIRNMERIKRQAQDHAIGRKLLLDEARRANERVPDADIDDAIASARNGMGGEEAFRAHLSKKGLTPEKFRDTVRNALLVEQRVKSITAAAAPATEEEAAAYFRENRGDFGESAQFNQVKEIVALAITNARKNELLVRHIEDLKREAGIAATCDTTEQPL